AGALEPREALFEPRIERMVSGDQPRCARADAIGLDCSDCGFLDLRMLAQIEIIVATERQQPPTLAHHPEAVLAVRFGESPQHAARGESRKLVLRELVQRVHVWRVCAR